MEGGKKGEREGWNGEGKKGGGEKFQRHNTDNYEMEPNRSNVVLQKMKTEVQNIFLNYKL